MAHVEEAGRQQGVDENTSRKIGAETAKGLGLRVRGLGFKTTLDATKKTGWRLAGLGFGAEGEDEGIS